MQLTDEIERRIGYRIPSPHIDLLLAYIAEREAAVLAKLARQEPVAMRYDFDGYGYKYIDSGSGSDWRSRIPDAEAVYAAPLPAPQQADRQRVPAIMRDALDALTELLRAVEADKDDHDGYDARDVRNWVNVRDRMRAMLAAAPEAPAQADRQRVPDGWKLVPVEPGEWVFADKVLGHDSHPNHKERMRRLYRAMLAAAPEAPAQASAVDERDRKDAERWRQWISGQSLTVVVPTPTEKNPESKTTIVYSPNPYSGFAEAMNRAADAALAQKGGQ